MEKFFVRRINLRIRRATVIWYVNSWIAILMAVMLSLALSSCGGDDNDEPDYSTSIPRTRTMYVGKSFSLGVSGKWTSSNEFVATVNSTGVVTAKHVGKCSISDGNNTCIVTVSATSTFMKEPITEWGISKSEVISRCGSDYKSSGNAIGYASGISKTPFTVYLFKDNKLSSSAILASVDYTEALVDFLAERYVYVGRDGYDYFFANGLTVQQITTGVGIQLYNDDYWMVGYFPFQSSRCETDEISDIKSVVKLME